MNLPLQFDSAFFEKSRLSILTIIYKEQEVSYNRLKKVLGLTDGALFSHIKKLVEADYITGEKKIIAHNAVTVYTLTKKGKKEFSDYLKYLNQFIIEISDPGKEKK